MTIRISNVDPFDEVALVLLREAVLDVGLLYHKESALDLPLPKNVPLGPRDVYIAAWLGDVPVGCGAIREMDQSTAELKRMYVHRDFRRRQIARTILQHLEGEARRLGYTRLLLETGDRQAPAMSLYEASGYCRIASYGQHLDDPTSIFYERHL